MRRSATYRAHPAGDRRGFTLIELVVVITIASVLAAYVAPRFWSQQAFSDRGYVDELAAALIRALQDPDLRLHMREKGRTLVREKFDVRNLAKNLEDIYDEVSNDATSKEHVLMASSAVG